MKVITALLERKKELQSQIEAAHEELRVIEISLSAFENIGLSTNIKASLAPQADLFAPKFRRKTPAITIKEMILTVLAESNYGLDAQAILKEINDRWKKDLVRSSLSPQLSRLKQSGHLIYANQKWLLAQQHEASDGETSEARDGEVFTNTNPNSIKLPLTGPNSVAPNRKEDE
ncbi:hypothetical protein Q1W73_02655 [Asticcacaulis sp. ZE23SCel15]|uniref:hypothetical protein n=1 Tax=Asticcacaulis sp. ZE23SCel15 TaxID=3059027 RepID=UPI00265DD890|nr:hypothetical protein [Asticcacaulis sp. ZE23SCel15]WKL57899.1 hypothetical protein Q1W73_02655 [Asticcacaulis sp. ZE23SCel15]